MSARWSNTDNQGITPWEVLLASEAYFLRAEGALKGWNMQITAQEAYNKGIEMSLLYWGATPAQVTAYQAGTTTPIALPDFSTPAMSDITAKWSSDGSKNLEQIITQKWIALFPDGVEAWADLRRTEFPKLYPIIHSENPDVPENAIMHRVQYVPDEYNTNAAAIAAGLTLLGGPDKANTRLWWNPAK